MGKDIATTPVGGNSDIAAAHFNLDYAKFPEGTDATQFSEAFDLGESLDGNWLAVRVGDNAVALGTDSMSIDILVGDDKAAAGTSTAWSTAATFTGTGTLAAGALIGSYVPAPGESKKYWMGKATGLNGTGVEAGAIGVYNEANPIAALR